MIPFDIRHNGNCEVCGEFSTDLLHIFAYGYDTYACPKCRDEIQKRIRRRYITAGEHTEPAE